MGDSAVIALSSAIFDWEGECSILVSLPHCSFSLGLSRSAGNFADGLFYETVSTILYVR